MRRGGIGAAAKYREPILVERQTVRKLHRMRRGRFLCPKSAPQRGGGNVLQFAARIHASELEFSDQVIWKIQSGLHFYSKPANRFAVNGTITNSKGVPVRAPIFGGRGWRMGACGLLSALLLVGEAHDGGCFFDEKRFRLVAAHTSP